MKLDLANVKDNLQILGPKRMIALALAFSGLVLVIGLGSVFLNQPTYEPLYVGLERDDVSRMGAVLGDAGIAYDVNAESDTLLVEVGKSSRARMILAEKGLPTSSGAGYELFDNLGSLGLTSFMQEVTRVRALEGEIARSIQTLSGVKAARVHIVMADDGNFRRAEQVPTASVIVRFDRDGVDRAAGAMRHLVAAAVPGLSTDKVTILDSNGRLLASGDDNSNNSARSSVALEMTVENEVADSIHQALAPIIGTDNFRVSVQADINTDQKQIEETIFDPDSRIERSVQIVRSEDASTERLASDAVTVEQGLPEEDIAGGDAGGDNSERSERREETTNYELSSRTVATTSAGYSVSRLSIAIVLNRAQFVDANGAALDQPQIDVRLAEIDQIVKAAAGYIEERGDFINTTALAFVDPDVETGTVAPSAIASLSEYAGTAINAAAFVIAVLVAVIFGLRPITRALQTGDFGRALHLSDEAELDPLASDPGANKLADAREVTEEQDGEIRLLPEPSERLRKIVDIDERRAADILRRWVNHEVSAHE